MLNPLEMIERYTVQELGKIKRVCEPLSQTFDVNFFYYNHISSSGDLASLGSHVNWMSYYYSQPLWRDNPFFRSPQFLSDGFYFFRETGSENIRETIRTAEDKYKITPKAVFIRKSKYGCTQFGLGISNSSKIKESLLINESGTLTKFFKHFEESLCDVISRAKNNPVTLLSSAMGTSFVQNPILQKVRLTQEEKLALFKHTIPDYILKVQFSSREKECADLLLQDLTAKQIAEKLSVSHRTTEFYIQNIRQKTGNLYRKDLKQLLEQLRDLELV